VGAVLLIGAGLGALHLSGVLLCVFHQLTGLPCLTCGSSRAAAALLRGDVLGAVVLQPLATLGGLLVAAACGVHAFFLLALRRSVRIRFAPERIRSVWLALLALAVLNWAYLVRFVN
jgi:hypothetical protein